jgi:thymidine phosphorylase
VAFLKGERQEPRLLEVTRALSAELLQLGGLASDMPQALQKVDAVLQSGHALERFARMVQVLGGPADFCERPAHYLVGAPVQHAVLAPRSGWLRSMATREVGLLVIALGGGRHHAGDTIDARVGLSDVAKLGQQVNTGDVLAVVHAGDPAAADQVAGKLLELMEIGEAPTDVAPVMVQRLTA